VNAAAPPAGAVGEVEAAMQVLIPPLTFEPTVIMLLAVMFAIELRAARVRRRVWRPNVRGGGLNPVPLGGSDVSAKAEGNMPPPSHHGSADVAQPAALQTSEPDAALDHNSEDAPAPGSPAQASPSPAQPAQASYPPDPVPVVRGYRVTAPLGQGGSGTVWRATQLATRREVALKLLKPTLFGSAPARARFAREVELTARLDHPGVARVYESGLDRGAYFYAMELVDGGVPLDRYARQQRLTHRQVLELMLPVCDAVQHAHDRGVLHRDLKPANILVTPDGRPKVLDFGLAKATASASLADAEQGTPVSIDGEAVGTPAFMSPEQAAGGVVDARADVYALGVILHWLVTDRAPDGPTAGAGQRVRLATQVLRSGRSDATDPDLAYLASLAGRSPACQALLEAMAAGTIPRPRNASHLFDRKLKGVLLKALAHDTGRRYEAASALAADIRNYLAGHPITAHRSRFGAGTGVFRKCTGQHRARVLIGFAMFAVIVTQAAVVYRRIAHAKVTSERVTRHDQAREPRSVVHRTGTVYKIVRFVTVPVARVHSGPSESFYPTTFLKEGAAVTVVGIRNDWLKILPPSGSFCYVPKAYVERAGDSRRGRVIRALSVRAGSSVTQMKTTMQTKLIEGTDVRIIGEQDEFYKIDPPEGVYLYVRRIDVGHKANETTDGAVILPGPSEVSRGRPGHMPGPTKRETTAAGEFRITTIALCRKVSGFGSYEPMPTSVVEGLTIPAIVYCELVNVGSSRKKDTSGWESLLAYEVVLSRTDDKEIRTLSQNAVVDVSPSRRENFFVAIPVELPSTLMAGRYVLKVTVRDEQADRPSVATVSLHVVAQTHQNPDAK
jgi:serine/threonine protein kinase